MFQNILEISIYDYKIFFGKESENNNANKNHSQHFMIIYLHQQIRGFL